MLIYRQATPQKFEALGLERWLAGLREELVSKIYRPDPVRRVMIPKPGGGERALGIPTIRDRVVQTAAKLLLEADLRGGLRGQCLRLPTYCPCGVRCSGGITLI